jgi:branched-chain amino acid transport system ATP-binding protein
VRVLLAVKNLKKFFGGITAVNDVSFQIQEGEVGSIIGPNGAGKTTLFNLITGKIKPDTGAVIFRGEEITGLPSYEICHKKIGRSFQITNIFPQLTVYDNILVSVLSRQRQSRSIFRRADRIAREEVLAILESVGIADKRDILGGLLAHGDQKRLDIGITLANHPELLLLDEPTAGMSPEETRMITELVQRLAREGNLAVVLIEHDMNVVFSISHIIRVMHQGKLIAEDGPEAIRSNRQVQEIYLGTQEWTS